MSDTPLDRYRQCLQNNQLQADPAQLRAVERLQLTYEALVAQQQRTLRRGWMQKLAPFKRTRDPLIQGVYLWGGVGRGKTFLMDLFFDTLPLETKKRTHFHRFMRQVHSELTRLKGEVNPLDKVAEAMAKETSVLCFDEFFVSDITDAMILANLLRALFQRGVTLIATSNIEPDGLYRDGLQRERFLPAIALLNQCTDVINVDNGTDYRLRELVKAEVFYAPLNSAAEQALQQCFKRLIPDPAAMRQDVELAIEKRVIRARYEADDVIWFEFDALCNGPRSQNDYIVLAKEYHAVIISSVPALGRHNDDQARRFVYLVDEFYDRGVKLILSAERPLTQLYSGGKLEFEFCRTVSRLLEMQSEAYLAQPHRP